MEMFVKNGNFRQKSNFLSKNEIFVKNRNFLQKSKLSSTLIIKCGAGLGKNSVKNWSLNPQCQNYYVLLVIIDHQIFFFDIVVIL